MINKFKNYTIKNLGGLNNFNLLINYYGNYYVLKVPSSKERHLLKKNIIETISTYNLTPKYLYFNDDTNVSLSIYLENSHSFKYMNEDFFLKKLAISLKKFHNMPLNYNEFSPIKDIELKIKFLKSYSTDIDFDLINNLFNKCVSLLNEYKNFSHIGFCHNDLNISNILYFKKTIFFIDFEYSSTGDIFYDLATFCWLLPNAKQYTFLKYYFNKSPSKFLLKKLSDFLFIYKFWNMLWSYIKSIDSLASDYDFKKAADFILNDLKAKEL